MKVVLVINKEKIKSASEKKVVIKSKFQLDENKGEAYKTKKD